MPKTAQVPSVPVSSSEPCTTLVMMMVMVMMMMIMLMITMMLWVPAAHP
jgi:hypothetical protein